jgi:hypothetical protein
VTIAADPLVCPRCGAAAGATATCGGCGLELTALRELPRRSAWEATAMRRPVTAASIRPLRHPTERSRFALALVASAVVILFVVLVGVVSAKAGFLSYLLRIGVSLILFAGLVWFGQQLYRARLLGASVRVGPDTVPALQELIDEVRSTLGYRKRVDIYVVDTVKGPVPIVTSSYLGTRIVIIEGDLVADMLSSPGGRDQLTFLLGRSIGALCAKHLRLDLFVVLLASLDALKYISPFLRPWFRATAYSGDQIGMACCSNLEAALLAMRRLLVGKELADDLPTGNVLPQACLVQKRLLPRLVQLLAPEPHVTNRYANLICFARYHDPVLWERLRASMPPAQQEAVDRLWQRSPYRRRVVSAPPVVAPA